MSLPDEVLINYVFPQLNLPYLLYLCQLNARFANICQNDRLWQMLTGSHYGITVIPPGLNSWRETYRYGEVLNNPVVAIPYMEEAIKQQRSGIVNPFGEYLINVYKPAITNISGVDNVGNITNFIIHRLALYEPSTGKFKLANSLDQIRILRPEENNWRNVTPEEAYTIATYFRTSVNLGFARIFDKISFMMLMKQVMG
jgi:hypothetical protein